MNPIVYGDYPKSMKITAGLRIPTFTDLESKKIKGSSDFIGLNYYMPAHVKDDTHSRKGENRHFSFSADIGAIPICKLKKLTLSYCYVLLFLQR